MPWIGIVDDDVAMRTALAEFLDSAGFLNRSYPSALAFLRDYAPGRFAAVITDLKMPGMDGLQLLERLRSLGNAPPVVIVTSCAGTETRARAIDRGAIAFLAKPVASDVLLNLMKTILDPPAEQ